MSASISSILPKRISPVSTGLLTVNGSGFTGAKSVSVDGRPCTAMTVASDTQLTATWPMRVTAGIWNHAGGNAPVIVTLADDSQVSGAVEYMAPVDSRVVQAINSRLSHASTANGYFYDWSGAEIVSFNVDPQTWQTGTWKKVVSYLEELVELPEEECGGFRTFAGRGHLDGVVPLSTLGNATLEASYILADLYRAVMGDLGNVWNGTGTTDTIRVTKRDLVTIGGLACGQLIVAGIEYEFKMQHIQNDATQNVSWTSAY